MVITFIKVDFKRKFFKIEYFIADNEWLVGRRKTDFDSVRLFIESLIGLGIIKEEL